MGPTATGKTRAGISVALRARGEVLTADSMQVYKLMDIGTAKPSLNERQGVPHHLLDLVYPDEPFSVAAYQKAAREKIEEVFERDNLPLLVGGTGLYVKALVDSYYFIPVDPSPSLRAELYERETRQPGVLRRELERIDPVAAAKIHPRDLRRTVRALEVYFQTGVPISRSWGSRKPPFDVLMFGLRANREWLYQRIEQRARQQVEDGLVEEVAGLLERGYSETLTSMQGLGYKEMVPYLKGRCTLEEAIDTIVTNTRRFAKRQFTWFRPDRRILWLDVGKPNGLEAAVEEIVRAVEGTRRRLDE